MGCSVMTASTSNTSTSPMRTESSFIHQPWPMPLAVFMRIGWPFLYFSPIRSASVRPTATVEAPVSIMNCITCPLMVPLFTKWPRLSAISVMRLPLPLPPPTLTPAPTPTPRPRPAAPPAPGVRRPPRISTVASSLVVAIPFPPWYCPPTPTARGGLASTTSKALLPSMPARVTDWAWPAEGSSQSAPHRAAKARRAVGCWRNVRGAVMVDGWLGGGRRCAGSIAEVVERQRHIGHLLADQGHRGLQVVALGAGHAHLVFLDRALDLELAVLEQLLDLPGQFASDAAAHLEQLFDLVAADLAHLADVEKAHIDAALGQLVAQHVFDLGELEVGIVDERDLALLDRYAGRSAFEVETGGDFLGGVLDRVPDVNQVGFANSVKRWHGGSRSRETRGMAQTAQCDNRANGSREQRLFAALEHLWPRRARPRPGARALCG